MADIGIRALKQNASAVVTRAAAGERLTITDRGRPVAEIGPMTASSLAAIVASGRARAPRRSLADLPRPRPGARLSEALAAVRDGERF